MYISVMFQNYLAIQYVIQYTFANYVCHCDNEQKQINKNPICFHEKKKFNFRICHFISEFCKDTCDSKRYISSIFIIILL